MTTFSTQQLVSTGIKRFKPTDITTGNNKKFDNDYLFEDQRLSGLVNPTFKAWYCKHFYRLGKDKVLQLASIAKVDGNNSARLFSFLLKKS